MITDNTRYSPNHNPRNIYIVHWSTFVYTKYSIVKLFKFYGETVQSKENCGVTPGIELVTFSVWVGIGIVMSYYT